MDAGTLFPVLAVIFLTVILVHRHQEGVESAYNTFEYFRKMVGAILLILVSWTFIRSGSFFLYLTALALVVFATVWFLIERPDEDLV